MTTAITTMIAEFTTEGVMLKTPDGLQQKPVAAPDFIKVLVSKLPDIMSSSTSCTLLPLGTIFTERTVNSFRIAIYVPAHTHTCSLQHKDTGDITEYDLPLPNIVMEARMRINESGSYGLDQQAYSLYCTDLPPDVVAQRLKKGFSRVGTSSTGVGPEGKGFYFLPLTNMYGSGYLCLGNNSTDSVFQPDNLLGVSRYLDICLNSPGNNDLAINGLIYDKPLGRAYGDRSPSRLFKEWAKLSSFPYDNVQSFE